MIKLVASDLDGTILRNGAQSVDESLYSVINTLIKDKVIFAPASGRQLYSLKKLFEPVADKLMYIAENGALVSYKNKIIAKTPMDRDLAMEIMNDVYAKKNCEVLISGEKTAYVRPKDTQYYSFMTEVVNYDVTIIDSFDEIKEDIIKVAVCEMTGNINNSSDYFIKRWSNDAAVAVSGDRYMDFNHPNASKGHAIRQIQEYLDIREDECVAFGDNYNDITMLDSVGYPFVMDTAEDAVKEHGKNETDCVEKILRKIFNIYD